MKEKLGDNMDIRSEDGKMMFELEFTGYGYFKSRDEAELFQAEMEAALGFLTKDNIQLYATSLKDEEEFKEANEIDL